MIPSASHIEETGPVAGGVLERKDTDMEVILNGEPHPLPSPMTVSALLERLDIDARRVAVEVNETVIKRARYDETTIEDGDAVEIVNFVGGG